MTTESRMREALEGLIAAAECAHSEYRYVRLVGTHHKEPSEIERKLSAQIKLAREALSPPARRTSYEFERELLLLRLRSAIADKEWVTACANMETEHRDGWSCDWPAGMREAHNEIESIIATLAGLTKPGEDEHG